ncbi:O-antigen ligase family protein [Pararhodospirillum oryzae]|uniref:O-antigen polymerase n=1 Tax=Pararhodospirillum oryzae TaxID=478448 RepID=A0A512H9F5_9PROT|nr:O-antigen ligase family protein [Pararhodospirillum oryzae]GEO82084.1 O-antigen polymerase [Pararhodospirillum oryzae]
MTRIGWLALALLASVPFTAVHAHSQVILPVGVLALTGLWRLAREPGTGAFLASWVRSPVFVCCALFAAWVMISAAWSPASGTALWRPFVTVPGILGAGLLLGRALAPLPPGDPLGRWGTRALAAGLLGGVGSFYAGLGVRVVDPGVLPFALPDPLPPLFVFNPAVSIWTLLLWPAVLLFLREGRGKLAAGLGVALASVVLLSESEASKVALLAGGVASAIALALPRITCRAVAWGAAAGFLALPLAVTRLLSDGTLAALAPGLGFSVQHRLLIWRFVTERILEHPWVGWGIGASRAFKGAPVEARIFTPDQGWQTRMVDALPIHPHNMPLQIWFETGLVGLLPVIAGLAWAGWRLGRRDGPPRSERALLAGVLATGVALSLGSYEAWQAWTLTSGLLAASLTSLGHKAGPGRG